MPANSGSERSLCNARNKNAHSAPISSQVPTAASQCPEAEHAAVGLPLNPLLQLALQVLPGSVVAPQANCPPSGLGGSPAQAVVQQYGSKTQAESLLSWLQPPSPRVHQSVAVCPVTHLFWSKNTTVCYARVQSRLADGTTSEPGSPAHACVASCHRCPVWQTHS